MPAHDHYGPETYRTFRAKVFRANNVARARYPCLVCGKKCGTSSRLEVHVISHEKPKLSPAARAYAINRARNLELGLVPGRNIDEGEGDAHDVGDEEEYLHDHPTDADAVANVYHGQQPLFNELHARMQEFVDRRNRRNQPDEAEAVGQFGTGLGQVATDVVGVLTLPMVLALCLLGLVSFLFGFLSS